MLHLSLLKKGGYVVLLNTLAVEWFYSQISKQLHAGELEARSGYIKQIPVPDINATQKKSGSNTR